MRRLIDELRGARPMVIAEALEQAHNHWPDVEQMMRKAACRGNNFVIIKPSDRTPLQRAICAAVAEKAKSEGFKVERLVNEPDAMSAALGASEGAEWKLSW